MKTFLIITVLILLFDGCSQHTAFGEFNFTKTQELTEDSIQSFKIKKGHDIDGIVHVVYLNKVFPKRYKKDEYFYVYYYLKDQNAKVSFLLNNKKALSKKQLSANNEFSEILSFNAPWSKYYLVKFKEEGNLLLFTIKTDKAAEATLKFVKDK